MKAQRKFILVYPKFQLRLVAVNSGILLGGFGFIGFQAWRFLNNFREMGVNAQFPADHGYFKFIEFQSFTMLGYLGFAFVISLAASTLATLVLSHRLSGPIVRLREFFEGVASGNRDASDPIAFREDDYFAELPAAVNQAM